MQKNEFFEGLITLWKPTELWLWVKYCGEIVAELRCGAPGAEARQLSILCAMIAMDF